MKLNNRQNNRKAKYTKVPSVNIFQRQKVRNSTRNGRARAYEIDKEI